MDKFTTGFPSAASSRPMRAMANVADSDNFSNKWETLPTRVFSCMVQIYDLRKKVLENYAISQDFSDL